MRDRLAHRDDLKERIIPAWSPGCRRLTPGDGYLEALIQDNVHCEFDDIASVDATGLWTTTGKHIEVDILACATGFYVRQSDGEEGLLLRDPIANDRDRRRDLQTSSIV